MENVTKSNKDCTVIKARRYFSTIYIICYSRLLTMVVAVVVADTNVITVI